MKLVLHLFSAAVLSLFAISAHADSFSYPTYMNVGTPTPATPLHAIASGDVTGTFVLSKAGSEDSVRLFDVTTNTYSAWLLDNSMSVAGTTADFGHVNAGDTLVFEINNGGLGPGSYYVLHQGGSPYPVLASDGSLSVDGRSHAFATSYPAGTLPGMGAFTYLAMEDLPAIASDFDYNDLNFTASNVTTATQTPEPGSLLLLGSGLAGVGMLLRRRRMV